MRACFLIGWIVVLAGACGPKHRPPPAGGDGDAGTGAGTSAGGASDATGGPASDAPLTRDECVRMIDHVLAIGVADQRARKAPEYVPTPEQVAKIREQMIAEQLDGCLAMPRAQWTCAVAATEMTSLYACSGDVP